MGTLLMPQADKAKTHKAASSKRREGRGTGRSGERRERVGIMEIILILIEAAG
ncbi:hypothetical protein GCM10007897_18320 [Sphingobium jiangsuense]|nr:hypothetical protein GCM10007897_18320 [Sphingobium jiangsuense]